MTDSGNSAAGTRAPLASCKRCGHSQCTCPVILADAISRWTGADYDTATGIAERVWRETAKNRDPAAEVPAVPVQRECVFCGKPVHKTTKGDVVANTMGPSLTLIPDPSCDNSPTQRHALP